MSLSKYLIFLFPLLICLEAFAETKVIKPGDNLESAIRKAKPGDTLLVSEGTYGGVTITNKRASASKPIIIKAKGDGVVILDGQRRRRALLLQETSYLAFEGLRFVNGKYEGVAVQNSAHIVFVDNIIDGTEGAGLKIGGRYKTDDTLSHHVDWIGGEIKNTGRHLDGAYGESIYLGQAWQARDYSHDIWIEGVKITDNPGAEGIDVKSEVYNINLVRNEIFKIRPTVHQKANGDPVNHVNDSAIVVSGGRSIRGRENTADRFSNVWIEGNTIRNITSNEPLRGSGIVFWNNPGVIVFGNKISNVEGAGIRSFTCCDNVLNYENYLFENSVSNTTHCPLDVNNRQVRVQTSRSSVPSSVFNNRPQKQTWYQSHGQRRRALFKTGFHFERKLATLIDWTLDKIKRELAKKV